MPLIHAIPAQARAAGTYQSPTATYDGSAGLTATAELVDPNWATTTPTTLVATLSGEENFNLNALPNDPGWVAFVGPDTWSPPFTIKGGALPEIEAIMPTGGDGKGQRLVRLNLTISDPQHSGNIWSGGVDLTIA